MELFSVKRQMLLLVLLTAALYSGCLSYEFVWDDFWLIVDNPDMTNILWFHDAFTGELYGRVSPDGFTNFYRPLQTVLNRVDFSLWGLNPFGYHLTNVFLHICNVLLVAWFLRRVLKDALAAFLGALFFAIHPTHAEAVCYIAGRADLLANMFIVIAAGLLIKNAEDNDESMRRISVWGIMICFVAALCSKEMALGFVLFAGFWHFFKPSTIHARSLHYGVIGGVVALGVIYVVLRSHILNFGDQPISQLVVSDVLHRLWAFCVSMGRYCGILVFPFGLHIERRLLLPNTLLADPFFFVEVVSGALILISLVIILFQKRNTAASFFIFWFLVWLFPQSNVMMPLNSTLAEHWLYTASIGFCALVGMLLNYIIKPLIVEPSIFSVVKKGRTVLIYTIVTVAIAYYAGAALHQIPVWRSDELLFQNAVRWAPFLDRPYFMLGAVYHKQGRLDEAIRSYEEALQVNPGYRDAYMNLGALYAQKGDDEKAHFYFDKVLAIDPDNMQVRLNRARLYLAQGKISRACAALDLVLQQAPDMKEALVSRAHAAYLKGDYTDAMHRFKSLAISYPEDVDILSGLGGAYAALGKFRAAIAIYEIALRVDVCNPLIYFNLGNIYFQMGQTSRAEFFWEQALSADPEFSLAQEAIRKLHNLLK